MSRMSKEESARYEGASWCLEMIDRIGLEATKEEMRIRGVNHCPLQISKADVKRFEQAIKINIINTVVLMSSMVLRDEFEFTPEQIRDFTIRFNSKTDCLNDDLLTWDDMAETMKEETGLDFELVDVEGRRK